jgi:hypothetical protein
MAVAITPSISDGSRSNFKARAISLFSASPIVNGCTDGSRIGGGAYGVWSGHKSDCKKLDDALSSLATVEPEARSYRAFQGTHSTIGVASRSTGNPFSITLLLFDPGHPVGFHFHILAAREENTLQFRVRAERKFMNRINLIWPVQSPSQKYFGFRTPQITSRTLGIPPHKRGVGHRHERGEGCGGRGSVRRAT